MKLHYNYMFDYCMSIGILMMYLVQNQYIVSAFFRLGNVQYLVYCFRHHLERCFFFFLLLFFFFFSKLNWNQNKHFIKFLGGLYPFCCFWISQSLIKMLHTNNKPYLNIFSQSKQMWSQASSRSDIFTIILLWMFGFLTNTVLQTIGFYKNKQYYTKAEAVTSLTENGQMPRSNETIFNLRWKQIQRYQ